MHRACPTTVLATLLGLCVAVPASANWSPNGVLVMTDPSHSIGYASLAKNDAGEVFVWASRYAGGAGRAILANRLNPDGSMGAGLGVDATDQTSGIPDGTGGFLHAESFHDIYVFRYQHAGGPAAGWPAGGLLVAGTTADEEYAQVVPDGSGGAVVAYAEYPTRIRVKHALATGTLDASWPSTGRILNDTGDGYVPSSPLAISDGAGGAYVAWQGDVPRIQHVMASGAVDPLWTAGGVPLTSVPPSGALLAVFPAGSSGLIVGWTSGSDVILQRLGTDGNIDGSWPSDGLVIPVGSDPSVISDGSGGALLAWQSGSSLLGTRIQSDGTFAPGWPASGRSLLDGATAALASSYTTMAIGPAGGFVVCWNDTRRPGHRLVRARWLLANGDTDPAMPDSGVVASPTATNASVRSAISDGAGGVFVAWIYDWFPSYPENDLYVTWLPYPSGSVSVPHAPFGAEMSLAAFPNPAHGEVAVQCALASAAPAKLQLIDLAGRVVREREISGAGERLERIGSAGGLAPGVYLVRLAQLGKSRTTRVAIVR